MTHEDIESTKAPLLEHLIELRQRLLRAIIAIFIAFVVCFFLASHIFNILVIPYERAAGPLSGYHLDQLLVELCLPAPLPLLVQFAAEEAEQRRLHFCQAQPRPDAS